MGENELEEGEYVEDEEDEQPQNQLGRRKIDNAKRFDRKEKDKRCSGLFRSALNAVIAGSSSTESRKRRHSDEDDAEMLRQQLLKSIGSQERNSNNRETKKLAVQKRLAQQKSQSNIAENFSIPSTSANSANVPIMPNTTNPESNEDIDKLINTLFQAKRQHAEMVKKKEKIQQSLTKCETDLDLKGQEISNLIEQISTGWKQQLNATQNLSPKIEKLDVKRNGDKKEEEKNQIRTESMPNSSKSQETLVAENVGKNPVIDGQQSSSKMLFQEISNCDVAIQTQPIPIAESTPKLNITKKGSEQAPVEKQPNSKKQPKIVREDEELEEGQIVDEENDKEEQETQTKMMNIQIEIVDGERGDEITKNGKGMEEENGKEMEKENGEGMEKENGKGMEEENGEVMEKENTMEETIVNRSQELDPFLMSIRSYRLSPLFPQNLIAHPAVSNRLNPHIPLCPYQLTGRCADQQCPFQHEEDYSLNEQQIVEEIIGYWPKICPNGMQPSQYATNLLANGPFDQVIGFLISRMPESIRIGHQSISLLFRRDAEKSSISVEDERVEYESILDKALTHSGNTIIIPM